MAFHQSAALVLLSTLTLASCSGSSVTENPGAAGGLGAAGASGPLGGTRATGGGGSLTSFGTAVGGGAPGSGGSTSAGGGTSAAANTGGTSAAGGGNFGGMATGGKGAASGGGVTTGGAATKATGGSSVDGGTAPFGGSKSSGGSPATGGTGATGGASPAGGGKTTGGAPASGGTGAMRGALPTGGAHAAVGTSATGDSDYPCDGSTSGYDAVMSKSGATWTVTNGGSQRYSGTDTQAALTAAYNSLSSGRTSKQSILVQGDGDIPASAQVSIPSYTVLNWCGTLNVSGSPSGSDRSPLYARGKTDIGIPNLKMTGSPQYGIFFRGTNNMRLGQIDLRLTAQAGIGIRVDTSGSASTDTSFNTNLTIDYVYGSGMGSHIVETYGIDGITIGKVEGNDVGECGLLLNRSINAEIGEVTCTDCATGTGYAAFRVANSVGKIGNDFPAGNIHVGKVYARGGGRGIFSVSGCGGLTIDQIDIANTGSTSILLQNTYNTTIVAKSGTVVGGLVQISNDTDNTNSGRYLPSENVAIKNLTLSGNASVRQDWCNEFGRNGCSATNVTGGNVSMCP